MAQVNSLTVNDGATTPTALVFQVVDRDGTKSSFRTDTAALVQGQKQVLHRADQAENGRAANKVRMTVIWPEEGVVDGITKVLSTSTAVVEINYAQGLTSDKRKTFYGFLGNLINHVDVKAQNVSVTPLS